MQDQLSRQANNSARSNISPIFIKMFFLTNCSTNRSFFLFVYVLEIGLSFHLQSNKRITLCFVNTRYQAAMFSCFGIFQREARALVAHPMLWRRCKDAAFLPLLHSRGWPNLFLLKAHESYQTLGDDKEEKGKLPLYFAQLVNFSPVSTLQPGTTTKKGSFEHFWQLQVLPWPDNAMRSKR